MRKTGIRSTRGAVERDWLPGVIELLRFYRGVGRAGPAMSSSGRRSTWGDRDSMRWRGT